MKKVAIAFLLILMVKIGYSQFSEEGTVRKQLDNESNQDTAWHLPRFYDNSWPEDNPKFGNGMYSVFRKAPYLLYPAANDEMLILWQMDSLRNCEFYWGTDTTYSEEPIIVNEFGNDHQYKVLLWNLEPKTKYFYKVFIDSASFKTGNFYTGAYDNDTKTSFFVYGDTRSNPATHDKVMEQMMDDMEQNPEMQTFVVSTGDIVSNGSKEVYWDNEFFSPDYDYIQRMLSSLPYLSAIGNHLRQGKLFKKYFPYPMYESDRFYYSFNYGPAHLIIIDQYTDYSPGSPQYEWLINDLSTTNKPWKFIFLHEPGWSAGSHSNNNTVQNIIQPLCKKYAVQFVFAGHNHYYSRAVVEGVFHITTGGGGAPLYTPHTKTNIVKISKTNHFCKVEIDDDSLTFTAITKNDSIIESFRTGHYPDAIIEKPENIANCFKVFPRESNIMVINKKHFSGNFSVYDNWGRKVYKGKLRDGENSIRIDIAGIYFVRINYKGNQIVKKIIIK